MIAGASFQRNDGVAGSISQISDPEAADGLGIWKFFMYW